MACGPAVAWDWFILDLAYIMVLVGGAAVLRARKSTFIAWVWFGMLSAAVGGFLFSVTYVMQTIVPEVAADTSTVALLTQC